MDWNITGKEMMDRLKVLTEQHKRDPDECLIAAARPGIYEQITAKLLAEKVDLFYQPTIVYCWPKLPDNYRGYTSKKLFEVDFCLYAEDGDRLPWSIDNISAISDQPQSGYVYFKPGELSQEVDYLSPINNKQEEKQMTDYKINIVVGDWSFDGHEKTETISYLCNKPGEEVQKAYKIGSDLLGVDLGRQCEEYEDDKFSKDFVDKLITANLQKEEDREQLEDYIYPDKFGDILPHLPCG